MTYRQFINKLRSYMTLNNGVLFIALLIATTWVWSTIDAIQRNFRLQQQVDSLSQEIAVSEIENQTLKFQNKYYGSQEFLELSSRERLNKAAPGEKLLVLPPNTVRPAAAEKPEVPEVPIAERSNFAQWMYFLFGKKS